jgi:hypothetical protein
VKYPKHPKEIPIRILNREIEDGMISGIRTEAGIPLSEKLNDYLVRLGYTSAHVTGIISQLLTQGKVRVDFRNHVERLELADLNDRLSSLQAVSLLNDYVLELNKGQTPNSNKLTQNIIVQPLKPLREP